MPTPTQTVSPSPGAAATSSTATADVDPVLARIPKAARENTQEGAEAFGKFFMEQVAQSLVAADPDLLRGLHSAECKTCANFRRTAANLEAAGEHHSKPSFIVQDTAIRRFLENEPSKFIEVTGQEVPVGIVNRSNATVDRTRQQDGIRFVLVLEFDTHWSVSAVHVEEE
ncbi:DUF6318 family protein [Intrasporangium sp. DVR]|uniref:DUF6318 family protein n=1 Tax=Intrasporangium sp. DVR TaxID=3127867 RepID=UPI00333E54FF